MSEPYHSALGRYSYQAETPSYNPAEFPHGEVHYYDVTSGLAKMGFIEKADVIYSDLPWRNGYHKFYKRSGLIPRLNYHDFLGYIGMQLLVLGKPAVIVSGDHARIPLTFYDTSIATRLNGAKARAYLWKIKPDVLEGCADSVEIIHRLADGYNCVGDFCCGYGRAGRIFAEHGCRFVLSDINADCIGYITENAGQWGPL